MPEYAPVLCIERKDNKTMNETEQNEVLKQIKDIVIKLELKDFEGNVVTPWLLCEYDEEEKSVLVAMFQVYDWEETNEENKKLEEILSIGNELEKLSSTTYNYSSYCEII